MRVGGIVHKMSQAIVAQSHLIQPVICREPEVPKFIANDVIKHHVSVFVMEISNFLVFNIEAEESVIARAHPKVPVLHEAHRIHIHQHKRQVIGIKIITQLQVGAFAFVENHHALVGPDEELFIIKLLDTSDGQAVGAVKIHINRGEVGILFHHKVYSEGGGNPKPTAIV